MEKMNLEIQKASWLEHIKRAKELNQIRNGMGNKHLEEANKIAELLQKRPKIKNLAK